MRIKCGTLFEKYGSLVPVEIMVKENETFLAGKSYIDVDDSIYNILDKKRKSGS